MELWPTASREELSIDLMRHTDEAAGAMDFLFAEMMLWGASQGYQRFSLGMAPLSGLESRPLVSCVALHRLDQVWDELAPPFEHDLDVGPGVVNHIPHPGEAVVAEKDVEPDGD